MTGAAGEQIRILVVDDYLLTRDMVRMILGGLGYHRVSAAESMQTALARLEETKYDLVICDWNMPNGTGLDLLRQVRANPMLSGIPFIMLTAEAYRENVVEALRAGANDYIAKPFTSQTLSEKIKKVLGPRAL